MMQLLDEFFMSNFRKCLERLDATVCSRTFAKDTGQSNVPIVRGVGFVPFFEMPVSIHSGVFHYPTIFGKSAAGWEKALHAMSIG